MFSIISDLSGFYGSYSHTFYTDQLHFDKFLLIYLKLTSLNFAYSVNVSWPKKMSIFKKKRSTKFFAMQDFLLRFKSFLNMDVCPALTFQWFLPEPV